MTNTTRRRRTRRAETSQAPAPPADPVKHATTSVLTALVFFTVAAFVMIPITWLLVHGYRWALS